MLQQKQAARVAPAGLCFAAAGLYLLNSAAQLGNGKGCAVFRSKGQKEKALSASGGENRKTLLVMGGIFALVGGIFLHFFFFVPVSRWVMAQSWEVVDCTVVESYVGEHRDSDGTTYSVNIAYTYEYNGRIYHGDRYDFIGGSSSGRSGKQKIVDQYPVGEVRTCYVNPNSPDQSVLTVEFQWLYLIGLFGGIFLVIGLALAFGRMPGLPDGKRRTWRDVAAEQFGVQADTLELSHGEGMTLKPATSKWASLIGVVIFALVWNGISGFVMYQTWSEGGFGIGSFLALVFGGIGALLLLAIPYQILAMLNPRPELTVTPGLIPLGGVVQLEWRFTGGTQRLQHLHIELAGVEEATYRQGTKTRTAKSTFFRQEIVEVDNPVDLQQGRVQFSVPADTMHTFQAANNKIKWSIRLKSDIPMWPDVKEEFPVIVRPLFKSEWEKLRDAVHSIGE